MYEGAIIEAVVEKLGAQGDGVAVANGRPIYVPLVLPGEKVKVKLGRTLGDGYLAELVEVLTASPLRVKPACPHFAACGGCTLQHLASADYVAHKKHVVEHALRQHQLGTGIEVRTPILLPAGTRRRLTLAALGRKDGSVILGFNARASHNLIDVQACPVAKPELVALLAPLRAALKPWLLKAKTLDVAISQTLSGIDILFTGPEPDLDARQELIALTQIPSVARLSWRKSERALAEPLLMLREPMVSFAGTSVLLPPGAFLQASAESEAVLTKLVVESLAGCSGPLADLFCGVGTFALPLARTHEVLAVEGEREAVLALRAATTGNKKISVDQRDLFRDPMSAAELEPCGGLVFDPPRAGAQAQAVELARSDVPCIVAVSCNPGTFGRDAKELINGGYHCDWVQPVDQFLWSGHVELVAQFSRK